MQGMTMIFVEKTTRKTAELLADSLCRKTQSCTGEMIGAIHPIAMDVTNSTPTAVTRILLPESPPRTYKGSTSASTETGPVQAQFGK